MRSGELRSAHDVAEGGFLVAVAECCLAGDIGASLELGPQATSSSAIAVRRVAGLGLRRVGHRAEALDRARPARRRSTILGTVGGDALDVDERRRRAITATLAELREAHAALAPLFLTRTSRPITQMLPFNLRAPRQV